jgi:hypothetical protein
MASIIMKKLKKSTNLYAFSRRLIDGEPGKILIETYEEDIETVTPEETMQVLDQLLQEEGISFSPSLKNAFPGTGVYG